MTSYIDKPNVLLISFAHSISDPIAIG